ncbi:hypothetical protein ACFVXG_30805 [Kitasatospora sp. NPDC058162]|uniref:hypothetical protein n=1 Tax=Kitasatospora sp. NPDC058162 TaxID=3346362 RepID=UPI0036DC10F7
MHDGLRHDEARTGAEDNPQMLVLLPGTAEHGDGLAVLCLVLGDVGTQLFSD